MWRSTASGVLAVVAAFSILVTVVSFDEASAFDKHSEYCSNKTDRTPNYEGSEWDLGMSNLPTPGALTLRDVFELGWEEWIYGPKDWTGTTSVLTPGDPFAVDFVASWKIGGAGAVTVCGWTNPLWGPVGGAKIAVNQTKVAALINAPIQEAISLSAHEWGHAWGLGHSGKFDNGIENTGAGDPPTMGTCLGSPAQGQLRATLSRDDYAGASYLDTSGTFNSVTANPSFENGTLFWTNSGVSMTPFMPGGVGTLRAMRMGVPNKNASSVRTYARVTDLETNLGDGRVANDKYYAQAWVRDMLPNVAGSVLLKARARRIVYKDKWDASCNFYGDDKNQLEPGSSGKGAWYQVAIHCFPTINWNWCKTPGQTQINSAPPAGAESGLDDPDAADVEIRIHNRATYFGSKIAVEIDLARIYWKF